MSESGQILRRSIGIVFSDGGLLALAASLPAGRGEHGDEVVAAVLCDPDAGPVQFDEALLSTEYGEDGVQRRATLELWPEEDSGRPLRGAGRLRAGGGAADVAGRQLLAFVHAPKRGRVALLAG